MQQTQHPTKNLQSSAEGLLLDIRTPYQRQKGQHTDHPKKMFCTVHSTHCLFLADDDLWSRNVLFSYIGVLLSFKTIQQICSERAVKVTLEA